MNDVVSERLRIILAKRSRTRRFNLATREPPPKDIVLAARVYADNGPHLVVVGRDCHPRSPHDIENSEIARVVDFLYSRALRLAYTFENGARVRNCASDNLANRFVCCILNQRGTAVGDKLVQIKHRLDPSLCMDCRVCPWPTLQSIHNDGSRRCLIWTSLSTTAVPLWLRMQHTNLFARLSLAQFLTLAPFSKV